MESDQSVTRINTLEIKSLICGKIGHQRAEKYFDHLQRLFTSKISKIEFNRLCIKAIGRENIVLHNRLIRSLIKNASVAKSPPPKAIRTFGKNAKILNGPLKIPLQSLYGDPTVPPKGRLRKFSDRPSPLGPLGKPQSVESVSKVQSATGLLSLGSKPPVEAASVEEGEEVEQVPGSPSIQSGGPVTAPFGVSINFRARARKSVSNLALCNDSLNNEMCQNRLELPDSRTLMNWLEKRLEMEGVRVSMDCVNLLNNGLDVYLKRLIEPCLRLASSHSWLGLVGRHKPRPEPSFHVSMLDFRTAIELNASILGEDWPIKFEKICTWASEEQDS